MVDPLDLVTRMLCVCQGMGVTGGSPIGFDVGTDPKYGTLPGLDQGVRGMRVGGLRKLLIPPELVTPASHCPNTSLYIAPFETSLSLQSWSLPLPP